MDEMILIPPEKLPGYLAYPHRHWYYVEARLGTTVEHILQDILDTVLKSSPGEEAAIIEERAVICLPTGERMQGVSFKAAHPAVGHAIHTYARCCSLKCGRLVDGAILLDEGPVISLAGCDCFAY
jgi:hypothetical protein